MLKENLPTEIPQHEMEAAGKEVFERLQIELKRPDLRFRTLTGDGWKVPALRQREFQVLTAVSVLGAKAFTLKIHERVQEWSVKPVDLSSVWAVLSNLEELKLVQARSTDPAVTGEGRQVIYSVTDKGEGALTRALAEHKQVEDTVEDSGPQKIFEY